VAWRLARIVRVLAWFGARHLARPRRGRDGDRAGAQMVREMLETLGGTFVKVGQQLSTRLDLLPADTCDELAKMLDATPAFPVQQAIAAVERTTGRPLADTFRAFDPEPLGSASIACVYHAVLHTGEDVAVKVRRPGIDALFAADLAALDVVLRVAEGLTLVRAGFTGAVRRELRTMLMEELDFHNEARYQALFRRQARRDRQDVTAPRVHRALCGAEVIVSEFVRGVWLQDLLAARERDDRDALAYCASLDIDPETVARRLLQTLYWANFENLFYHADPHPGNVVVRPGNALVFLDFGACGPTTHRNRRNYVELFRRQDERDIAGMVQVFGNIISPLPPLDLDALFREGETLTARWQYGFDSEHPQWWERSSAGMWIGMLDLTRRFNIPVNVETVRLVRSSLLYDTIAARLSDSINMQQEFRRYFRGARRRALRRMGTRWRQDAKTRGQTDPTPVLEQAGRFLYRIEDFVDRPAANSGRGRNEWAASWTILTHGLAIGLVTLTAAMLLAPGASGSTSAGFEAVAGRWWYWAGVGLVGWRCARLVGWQGMAV
jgi:ubiquinone biosynthesis protein